MSARSHPPVPIAVGSGGSGTDEVDARSDLYALDAVAYFLLTGTPVFRARSVVELSAHHLHSPPEPPSSRLGSPVPPELERVVLQCLAKSPDERPQSARALSRDLSRFRFTAAWSDDDAARWWDRYRRRSAERESAEAAAFAGAALGLVTSAGVHMRPSRTHVVDPTRTVRSVKKFQRT